MIYLQEITNHLLTDSTLNATFPNLTTLASQQLLFPVTTNNLERTFNDMWLVKATLRCWIEKNTLVQAKCVSIEYPPTMSDELVTIATSWKSMKPRRLQCKCANIYMYMCSYVTSLLSCIILVVQVKETLGDNFSRSEEAEMFGGPEKLPPRPPSI